MSRDGIRDATLILNGQTRIALRTGIVRADVAAVHAQYPNAAQSGFEGTATLESRPAGVIRVEVEVTDDNGRKAILATARWRPPTFARLGRRWPPSGHRCAMTSSIS